MNGNGDLNNVYAARPSRTIEEVDNTYSKRSLAISQDEDDLDVRERYRPFLPDSGKNETDWVADLELSTTLKMVESEILHQDRDRLRILVLYGSLRSR
jgi:arsenic resistance protein ArsH